MVFDYIAALLRTRKKFNVYPSRARSPKKLSLEVLESRVLLAGDVLESADGLWREVADIPASSLEGYQNYIRPTAYEPFSLDVDSLKTFLNGAPLEFTAAAETNPLIVTIPTPDDSFVSFAVVEAPILSPDLAALFPGIKTYRGQGIDDPLTSIRFDVTPNGFHAQVLSPDGSYYIDPYWHLNDSLYVSYYDSATSTALLPGEDVVDLGAKGAVVDAGGGDPILLGKAAARSGTQLRTYRAAVAATGEYTQFHGGSVAQAMGAITTSMNRVNGVFERELAIRMVLVANNNLLVYTDPLTDPYTDGNGPLLLTENQINLDTIIGNASYDIGHVFGTGGGGLAILGSVGVNAVKAQGETGSVSPVGDTFDIDFVAHEMGHQFGANHTFAGNQGACAGNVNAATAMEPNSGSTIMAYAGICGLDDLQPNSDPYFHSISFDEIITHVDTVIPTVGTRTQTGNTVPTVNAGIDYTIPAGTPFILTATASDPDNQPVTVNWEQRDAPGALFRSFTPTASRSRTFPQLADILSNTPTLGETLPAAASVLNFRATARDNRAGGGGVNTDDMVLTVINTGAPFAVTSPNTAINWQPNTTQTVTWNVSGTDMNGIDVLFVNVLLSVDGGQTFATVLAGNTPNDGMQNVIVPNVNINNARIKVEAVGNIFFDISDTDFSISSSPSGNTDYGDAPDTTIGQGANDYDTLLLNNGPSHVIGGPRLGALVDGEPDGFQSPTASGDDAVNADDEDGVAFGALIDGVTGTVNVQVSTADGFVNGWIDFNRNGLFEAGEVVVANQFFTAGTSAPITFAIPAGSAGTTFARFRVSAAGGLGPTGPALDGEVEDYQVTITTTQLDFGDAPDTGLGTSTGNYNTLLADNGPRHTIGGPRLGSRVDGEADGQQTAIANGDDAFGQDDEDGVSFSPISAGLNATATVTVTNAIGRVDAWIDWNKDGDFVDLGEQIITNQLVAAGATVPFTFAVPGGIPTGSTFARFRVSSAGGLASTGAALDGEVEDYLIALQTLDFGDLPDATPGNGPGDYNTLFANGGAAHIIGGPILGVLVDSEGDGQPSALADGDDLNGSDDEDGVAFNTMTTSQNATVSVAVSNANGYIDAWIDYNQNGKFEAGEKIVNNQLVAAGLSKVFQFFVPATATAGTTYARVRVSASGGVGPNGLVASGEVEDYRVTITQGSQVDYGDAPDPTFPTLIASNGASHVISSAGPILGTSIDGDANGQPNAGATGDDADGNDDDDGIIFTSSLVPGGTAVVRVTTSQANGFLDAWVDFNRNGTFDFGEQVFSSRPVTSSSSVLIAANRDDTENELIVIDSTSGKVISTIIAPQTVGVLNGVGFDGTNIWYIEGIGGTQDILYQIDLSGTVVSSTNLNADPAITFDRTFDGLAALNGLIYIQDSTANAIHVFNPATKVITNTLSPGVTLTGGLSAITGPNALLASNKDTKQIFEINPTTRAITNAFTHTLTSHSGTAVVNGLIYLANLGDADITVVNRQGTVQGTVTVTPGANTTSVSLRSIDGGSLGAGPNSTNLTFAIPVGASIGNTIARFRVSSAGGLSPVGQAPNGEVEDYQITIGKIDSIGVFRNGVFLQDITNDGAWNGVIGGDGIFNYGATGDIPAPGDWNGDGVTDLGVYRPSTSTFYKDKNGNRVFDAADEIVQFGAAGDLPVVGKFNAGTIDDVGVYRPSTATFYLDSSGNGVWDGIAGGDTMFTFGAVGDVPIVGNWNLDALDEVGVYRPSTAVFYRDANGNTTFDGIGGGDEVIPFGAIGDIPIIGNWNGAPKDKIGVFRPSNASFYQDTDGNGLFNGFDKIYQFGAATDLPVVGDWATPASIVAASGPATGPIDERQLTARQLDDIVNAAVSLLVEAGINESQVSTIDQLNFRIADLDGARLGQLLPGVITIDGNAAGYGWFVDTTPRDNEEFAIVGRQGLIAAGDSAAAGQMDLLTVVLHELGHALGLDDDLSTVDSAQLMNGLVSAGVRRLPTAGELAILLAGIE